MIINAIARVINKNLLIYHNPIDIFLCHVVRYDHFKKIIILNS